MHLHLLRTNFNMLVSRSSLVGLRPRFISGGYEFETILPHCAIKKFYPTFSSRPVRCSKGWDTLCYKEKKKKLHCVAHMSPTSFVVDFLMMWQCRMDRKFRARTSKVYPLIVCRLDSPQLQRGASVDFIFDVFWFTPVLV